MWDLENGFGFSIFEILFIIAFVAILGMLIIGIFGNIKTWHQNNKSVRLCVNAKVVSKRIHVTGSESTFTSYYVSFQVESGDRMEFSVDSHEYGMLVEGDEGKLHFQGTRYLSFERN